MPLTTIAERLASLPSALLHDPATFHRLNVRDARDLAKDWIRMRALLQEAHRCDLTGNHADSWIVRVRALLSAQEAE